MVIYFLKVYKAVEIMLNSSSYFWLLNFITLSLQMLIISIEVRMLCSNILFLFSVAPDRELRIFCFCYSYFFIYMSIKTEGSLFNVVRPSPKSFMT